MMELREAMRDLNDAVHSASKAAAHAATVTDEERAQIREFARMSDRIVDRLP